MTHTERIAERSQTVKLGLSPRDSEFNSLDVAQALGFLKTLEVIQIYGQG